MENISLGDIDEATVDNEEGGAESLEHGRLHLVGCFLTDRPIRTHIMKDRMAGVWRLGHGVTIKELVPGISSFQFFHAIRIQRVLKNGPWTSSVGVLEEGCAIEDVQLDTVPFWVQVHHLSIGFKSEAVGRSVCNTIKEFLEYDLNNSSSCLKTYMRIRVLIDVNKPLKKMMKLRKPGGEPKVVQFKHERLDNFCYICGFLGHTEAYCHKLFTIGVDGVTQGWRVSYARAEIRSSGAGGSDRWLREEGQTDWLSSNQSLTRSVTVAGSSQSANLVGSQLPKDTHGSDNNKVRNVNVVQKDQTNKIPTIFKNPQLYYAVKHPRVSESASHDQQPEIVMVDADVAKEGDRKKTRVDSDGTVITQASPTVTEQNIADNNIVNQSYVPETQPIGIDPFLFAGPGRDQAYQKP